MLLEMLESKSLLTMCMYQKDQLVEEIARHALPLVQNPFGNYVVQYVLELGVSRYSESVIQQFVNHVCTLSVQKFSSNVIENASTEICICQKDSVLIFSIVYSYC